VAAYISPELREKIKSANDIVDVIGEYLRLKKVGSNYAALCPFHREKTPSFMVNPRLQIFHCFGCHKGGDVVTFIMEYENINFFEAIKRLAARAGIPLELNTSPESNRLREKREQLLDVHQKLTEYWHNILLKASEAELAREYLCKRGIDSQVIRTFKLGYAPDRPDDTVRWGRANSIPLQLLEEAGVIIRRENTQEWYDRFRGRVIFPICNEQGWVIAFSGRVLTADNAVAKYLNSPETLIFRKGRVFYGLDKARRAIMDAGFAIVCEGQIDLIRIHLAGFPNVVAPQGTAFTSEHAQILKRYTDTVVLCFDSDEAGQRAMIRALDALLAAELNVKVAVIPPPDDPDSFILAYGAAAFQKIVNNAMEFFDYYLNRLCSTNDVASDQGKRSVIQQMAEAVSKARSVTLVESIATKTAARLGLTPLSVYTDFMKIYKTMLTDKPSLDAEEPGQKAKTFNMPPKEEMWLMQLLLHHPEVTNTVLSYLDISWINSVEARAIIEEIQRRIQLGVVIDAGSLLDCFEDEGIRSVITAAGTEQPIFSDLKAFTKDLLRRLRAKHIEKQLVELRRIIVSDAVGEEERHSAFKRFQELQIEKREPFPPATFEIK